MKLNPDSFVILFVLLWSVYAGAVLVFMPGLAEIKMLYEQLQSNRMFNNRHATRSVCRFTLAQVLFIVLHSEAMLG